jgi:hypothetical protein
VYAFDTGDLKVKVFDQNGNFLRQWGGVGTADGQFKLTSISSDATSMLAVDKNNEVYVCDPGNSRIQVFDSSGAFLRKWGQAGTLPNEFPAGAPDAVASLAGQIYAGATNATPTRIFSKDGTFVRLVAASIFANSFAVTPDELFLATASATEIRLLDPALTLLATFSNSPHNTSGGFAMVTKGDLYAIASDRKHIRVFGREYASVQNAGLPSAIPQPIVLSAAQRAGTTWMDIDYQVTDTDSPTVTTGVLAFKSPATGLSNVVLLNTFKEGTEANVGVNQPTGVPRRLTWDAAADWTGNPGPVQIEVLAKDSRNLLGVRWITIPASGTDPAVRISAAPVTDAQLLDLWYWFLATRKEGLSLSAQTVLGTAGTYNGQTLANGTGTTTPGRTYMYEQLGVRSITVAEQTRATAGNYGFSSVNSTSVVKVTGP